MLRALEFGPKFKTTYHEQGGNTLSRFLLVMGSRRREQLAHSVSASYRGPKLIRFGHGPRPSLRGSLSRGERETPMKQFATRRGFMNRPGTHASICRATSAGANFLPG